MIWHSKLVRDKIPQHLSERGIRFANIPLNNNDAITEALEQKLCEEVNELIEAVLRNDKLKEMADIYEVILALLKIRGFTVDDLIREANRKRSTVGGFDEGNYLIWTEK